MKRKTKMKKLIIAAAAVCLAFASQANVAVTWNTGTFGVPNVDGSIGSAVANGAAASTYWATITFWSDAGQTTEVALSSGGQTTGSYATKNGKGVGITTGSDFNTTGGPTYYAQVVLHALVNGDPKVEQTMTSDVGSFTFTDGTLSGKTINFTTGSGFDTASNLFSGKTWTAAPEPTSGILMLVGLGALALRRRKA